MTEANPSPVNGPRAELSDEQDLKNYAKEHLGFEEIKDRLADRATSALGKNLSSQLEIKVGREAVQMSLQETEQMRTLMQRSRVPLAGIADLEHILQRAQKGSVLTPEDLWITAECIEAAHNIQKFIKKRSEVAPTLAERVDDLGSDTSLADRLKQCVTEDGHVTDSASTKLSGIRRKIRTLSDKLRSQLEQMTKNSTVRTYLQEPIVTQRSSRFVLPVKAQHRDRVQGIVHGQSSSGATVFIEPQVAVELNNEIRNLKSEEEREIERILRELSGMVGQQVKSIRTDQRILAKIDLVYAKACLADEMDAVRPNINSANYVNLKKARHPLLEGDEGDVVPIDVEVGRDFDTLVITGPNTGGKTVTLKTVGLMVLMCQAGLHIPCDASSDVGVFQQVYCDIGDEQSIAQNLSTFSSHMRNVIPIVKLADSNTLVLLDELGAGTDPMEGAPLGMCVLEHLHERGVRTMATTHYSRLKTFAYRIDGIQNASMEFDPETLSPTYHLVMGLPGRSNALEIAQRLGMPERLIKRAKGLLSEDEGSVEELISAMEQDRKKWIEYRQKASQEAEDAEKLRERLARREQDMRQQKEKILGDARQQVREILADARQKSSSLINQLRSELNTLQEYQDQLRRRLEAQKKTNAESEEQQFDAEEIDTTEILRKAEALRDVLSSVEKSARNEIDTVDDEVFDEINVYPEKSHMDDCEETGEEKETVSVEELTPGIYVSVASLQQTGRVVEVDEENEEALVQIGVMKIRTEIDELAIVPDPNDQQTKNQVGQLSSTKRAMVPKEVTLRQHTVDEALRRLKKYLDDAFLAEHDEVTIIHGRGEGILRRAVRDYLEKNNQVVRWRKGKVSEGGNGVTIAFLR